MKLKLLLLLSCAAVAFSQTAIKINQILPPPNPNVCVLVSTPSPAGAMFICATLSGATLDMSTNPPTLRITSSGGTGNVPTFVDNEKPAGTIDGANPNFTLANVPNAGSLTFYRNGLRQAENVDYMISGRTITFATTAIPEVGDILLASYRH